ncbi:MAG: hypothetical protein H7Z75_05785 [Ferruginibacter sp.]|nr:hypothetical protein [Cytophagales bacterium]
MKPVIMEEREVLLVYKALFTEYLASESYLHPESDGKEKLSEYLDRIHDLYKKICVTQGLPDEIQSKIIEG